MAQAPARPVLPLGWGLSPLVCAHGQASSPLKGAVINTVLSLSREPGPMPLGGFFEVKQGSQQDIAMIDHRQPGCQSIPGVKGGGFLYLVLVIPAFAGMTLKMSPAAFACGS